MVNPIVLTETTLMLRAGVGDVSRPGFHVFEKLLDRPIEVSERPESLSRRHEALRFSNSTIPTINSSLVADSEPTAQPSARAKARRWWVGWLSN